MATVEEQRLVGVQDNPLVEGLERVPVAPTTLVIFGATGDLAMRKLLPALYNLAHEGSLPERFNLIGVSRSDLSDEDFRQTMRESIEQLLAQAPRSAGARGAAASRSAMSPGAFDDPGAYERLTRARRSLRRGGGLPFNRVFYLSTAPGFFPVIVAALGAAGLHRRPGLRGARRDREAVRLRPRVGARSEPRGARGLRRAAGVSHRPLPRQGDRPEPARLQVRERACSSRSGTATTSTPCRSRRRRTSGSARARGTTTRSGALRDLVQNHMLQLLTLLCMEPPAAFSADKLRDEKVKVTQAIRPPTAGRGAADGRARAVRPGRVGWRRGARLPRRGRVFRTDRRPRPTRPCGSRSPTGAGPGCPSTCAPASGSPAG